MGKASYVDISLKYRLFSTLACFRVAYSQAEALTFMSHPKPMNQSIIGDLFLERRSWRWQIELRACRWPLRGGKWLAPDG